MNKAAHLLTRNTRLTDAERPLRFLGDLSLATARVHEMTGAARRTLALMIARETHGPVFWITPGWAQDRIYTPRVASWINPGRLVFIDPKRAEDLLWSMEEILRTGLVPLVVADLPGPPGLTAVRRLHLAAETGAKEGRPPLGLLLTPGTGGAAGIETRWGLTPAHGPGNATGWILDRLRARTLPPARWDVTAQKDGGLSLRPHAQSAPGEHTTSRTH